MKGENDGCFASRHLFFILGLIFIAGVAVRCEDLRVWANHPEAGFYQGAPLLTNVDGYYYLRMAEELVKGTYSRTDGLRVVPDCPDRSSIPPFISVIAAVVHKLTSLPLRWVAVLVPVFLGPILIFPLYGIGRSFGGQIAGVISALAGVLSYTYFTRTSVGWYDTDCLNVTLTLAAIYCFLRFGEKKDGNRYRFLAAGLLNWFVFLWWWDTTPFVATLLSLIPLAIALLFYYRPPRSLRVPLGIFVLLVLLVVVVWKGERIYDFLYSSFSGVFSYLLQAETGPFPNISQVVGEQRELKFIEVVQGVTDSYPLLLLGFAGIIWLVLVNPKRSLFLAHLFFLSLAGMIWAQRFLIFLAPVFGLGIGFLAARLWMFRQRLRIFTVAVPVLVALLAAIMVQADIRHLGRSIHDPALYDGFRYIKNNTPENAVVWAWWDLGHPLIYWSRRGTIADGASHGGAQSVYGSIPYATDNPRLAANFIQFYVAHGRAGVERFAEAVGKGFGYGVEFLKKVLAYSPEKSACLLQKADLRAVGSTDSIDEWLAFLYPSEGRPVYFFLDYRLGMMAYWWYWLGTWGISDHRGLHSRIMPFYKVGMDEDGATNHKDFYADFRTGKVILPAMKKNLRSLSVYDQSGLVKRVKYHHDAMAHLEIYKPAFYALLLREDIRESLFNRFFLRHESSRFFLPLKLKTPVYQIYRVAGDRYVRKNG
ncbi:STT3 domain-containing protein [Desulfomarina sp.]